MKFFKEILKYFTFITTGIVILFIIIMLIQGDDALNLTTLIEIPCAGLATSVVTVLIYPSETKTKTGFLIRMLIHYLALCVIMILMGIQFGWIGFSVKDVLIMAVSVALVYAFTFTVSYLTSKNDADELNQALKNKRAQ